jgi:hypothetical protein
VNAKRGFGPLVLIAGLVLLAFGLVSWVVSGSYLRDVRDAIDGSAVGGGAIRTSDGIAAASTWMSYGIVAAIVGAVLVITWVIVRAVTAVDEGAPSVEAEG